MTDANSESWKGPEAEPSTAHRLLSLEQQLELVDRVIGLESQLAQLSAASALTPTEQLSTEQQLIRLQRSAAWRIGRIVTAPFRVSRRAIRRMRGT